MLEKTIQKLVYDYLRSHPKVALVWLTDSLRGIPKARNVRSRVGVPDIIGILQGGRAFAFELKTKDGAKRSKQIEFIETAQKAGALAGFCRSLEDVQILIESL